MGTWDARLAKLWTYDVPPSRPSVAELAYYAKWANEYRNRAQRRLKMLILGSTPEFRDWGYEEYAEVAVVDCSIEYYSTISREMRHKAAEEELFISRWEDMSFNEEFDLVIGDLVLGNVDPNRFDEFISRVADALCPGGLFMGKSFIWDKEATQEPPEAIIQDYYANSKGIHPYTFINHRLGFSCLNRETKMIGFADMYRCLCDLEEDGVAHKDIMQVFGELGWSSEMIATFFAPTRDDLFCAAEPYFVLLEFGGVRQLYSEFFPTFVFERK